MAQKKTAVTKIRAFEDPLEINPAFPGGNDSLRAYLTRNVHWPENSVKADGRIIVNFIVDTNGKLRDFQILKGIQPELDKEVTRVLKRMPRWKPGTVNGIAVRRRYALPILCSSATKTATLPR